MSHRLSSLSSLALAGLLLATVPLQAQLATKSPFLPAQGAAGSPTASAPLEFRGYMVTGGQMLFCIHNPARKASTWVKMNERNADFDVTVKGYDDEKLVLTVEHQGRSLHLAERVAKVVSSGAAAQAVPPPPSSPPVNVAPAVTQSVVLNPTPADEQRRLDAVAAEVARRRALREQAAQQVSPGQTQVAPGQAGAASQNPRLPPGVVPGVTPVNPADPRGRGPAAGAPRQQ